MPFLSSPPIRRKSRTIPYGYEVSEHDEQLLVPIPEIIRLLSVAKRAWEAGTSTQTDIAAWLSKKAGHPITRMGLKKRLYETHGKIAKRAKKES